MIRYLIDTDHLTLLEMGDAIIAQNVARRSPQEIAIAIVTVEETLRGRLALLARASTGLLRVRRYQELRESIHLLGALQILDYCDSAEARFLSLRGIKPQIGSQDLKIASIALAHSLVVVTRNRRDFGRVPGLSIEDGSID